MQNKPRQQRCPLIKLLVKWEHQNHSCFMGSESVMLHLQSPPKSPWNTFSIFNEIRFVFLMQIDVKNISCIGKSRDLNHYFFLPHSQQWMLWCDTLETCWTHLQFSTLHRELRWQCFKTYFEDSRWNDSTGIIKKIFCPRGNIFLVYKDNGSAVTSLTICK